MPLNPSGRVEGVTGVLLAGGASRRYGSNKALSPWKGRRLIEAALAGVRPLFKEVLVPVKDPEEYGFLDGAARVIADVSARLHPGVGLLTGLRASRTRRVFAFACDMPLLRPELVRRLCAAAGDAVVPVWRGEPQPMCAVYSDRCVEPLERLLEEGDFPLHELAGRVGAVFIEDGELSESDPCGLSFVDVDTPEDARRAEVLASAH